MKIQDEISLTSFEFWGGATYTTDYLTFEELEKLDSELSFLHPDGLSPTEINDLLNFEADFCLSLLGLTEEDIEARRADEASN